MALDMGELVPAMAAPSAEHTLDQLAAEILIAGPIVRQDTPKVRETVLEGGVRHRGSIV